MSIGIKISSLCLIALFAVNGLRAGDPASIADVVANDEVPVAWHVGLTRNGGANATVVEVYYRGAHVINGTSIQERPLPEFKAAAQYWGARYDNRTTAAQKLATWRSLYHQCDYHASYSLVLGLLRHRIVSNPKQEIAIEWTGVSFLKQNQTGWSCERCDFGVAAAYYEGTGRYYGRHLTQLWLPKYVFHNFPNSR